MPRLYAATFAATRIRRPQPVWASGDLSSKLSLKLAKVVSTTWRAALPQRRWAPGAAGDSGLRGAAYAVAQCLSHSSPRKPLSLRLGLCDTAPHLGNMAIPSVGGGT